MQRDDLETEGKEPGRYGAGTKGVTTERPVGKSTPRDSTGIDPQETQGSPQNISGDQGG